MNTAEHAREEFNDASQGDLITALTQSLECTEALIESAMETDLKDIDPMVAKMYLSTLLKIVNASKKISSEIFINKKIIH